jgi:O-antigen biosynthesis protein WbqP
VPADVVPSGPYRIVKRLADALFAALGLLVLCMPALVCAVAIRLDSPGPALHRQTRIGRGARRFTLLKFRTMASNAPLLSTADMQASGGYHVTRLGALLRRYSLDELPQLWNILRGDMSLVGPRPALHTQHGLIAERERRGVDRATPGLTGLAQVSGRDGIGDATKVDLDAAYVGALSVATDLRIIGLTVMAVIGGRGNR